MLGTNNPNPAPSIQETFPSEVIRMFLSPLSFRQLLGDMRVNPLWRFLGRAFFNSFLKKEYPFLEAENLNDSECLALLEKQQVIYVKLATENGLASEDLCRERLEAFYADKDKANFTLEQKAFLTTLAIASGMEGESKDKGEAFKLMARIGNRPMLEAWYNDESISVHKGGALKWAASNGHLSCVQSLIKNAGKEILKDKEVALKWAARNGHLPCVEYFIENVGVISSKDKGGALRVAADNGHLRCVQYLIEKVGKEISSEDKGGALKWAVENGHNVVMAYLKRDISSHALIFTGMSHGENKNKEMKDASSKKRGREEGNENENPKNKKIKVSPKNEAPKEKENDSKRPSCSLM